MNKTILAITTTFLVLVFLPSFGNTEDKEPLTQEEKARQKMLKLEAANALWRLKNSLEKDAFYSGRIRLNVWRSTAIEAGTFDQAQYDEFKEQLYVKSVNDSMKCYEEFILEEDFYNANICLQTWRMHSKELGTYDKEKYEALKEGLKRARAEKAARAAEEKKAAKTEP
jgi:glutathione S-transferase